MRGSRIVCWLMAACLAGCGVENFDRAGGPVDEAAYISAFPYYAEFCAVSQIKKKPGFGADIRGEIGGHAVFFLHGACRQDAAGYPVLRACEDGDGVGISVNAHFRNAKWVAIPGREFFFQGGLRPGERLTREAYRAAQAQAQRLGVYDGVDFHPVVFDDMPAGFSREAYKYEVSVATDYAIGFGRGRFCARVPVTQAQMGRMVVYLNDQNAPYRAGAREFHWSVFRDNCVHLAHNALAAAGLWTEWPIDRPLIISIFDFPVPKNEFVNTMRRTNDFALDDLAAVFADAAARRSLEVDGDLPLRAGALAEAMPPQRLNDVYDTDLKLIFYDEPNFGSYQGWFDRIFAEQRYFELSQNLADYAGVLRHAKATRRPVAAWLSELGSISEADRRNFAIFYGQFYAHVERQDAAVTVLRQRILDGLY